MTKITNKLLIKKLNNTKAIKALVKRGALFAVNHSGGKDSQAMMALVKTVVPVKQILVVHAHLPEVEWTEVISHIKATTGRAPFLEARSVKTFFDMALNPKPQHGYPRGMWPSPSYRQCTSDLKRGPIERELRRYLKANPRFGGLIVNCMGLRAQESPKRAKATVFKFNPSNSKAGREWYDWLPIHSLSTKQVFQTIKLSGQKPHWAYGAGMSRLSCVLCIMSNKADLITAAQQNPTVYAKYVAVEKFMGHTFQMPTKKHGTRYLEEITGVKAPRLLVKKETKLLLAKERARLEVLGLAA
jgi:DNA sulfur modification protein DndC